MSSALAGVDAFAVEVEVDIGDGRSRASGRSAWPKARSRESLDRVKSAIKNSGFEFPDAQDHRQSRSRRHPQGRIALSICRSRWDFSPPTNALKTRASAAIIVTGRAGARRPGQGNQGRAAHRAAGALARKFAGVMLPRENALEASVVGEGIDGARRRELHEAFEFFEDLRELAPRRSISARCSTPQSLRRRFQRGQGPGAGQAGARSGGRGRA